jgi:hypothetical protein
MDVAVENTGFHRKLRISLRKPVQDLCVVYLYQSLPNALIIDPYELNELFQGSRDGVYLQDPVRVDLEQPVFTAKNQSINMWIKLSEY